MPTTKRTTWALTVLFSLGLALLFLHFLSRRIGIDPYDESIYLFLARFVSLSSFVSHQAWSPLYLAWYRGLAALCPNPIARYFVSWSLLAGIVAMTPSLLRVKNAWLYTCLILALPALIVGPYVSLLAAAIFVAGLSILLQQGRSWHYSSAGVLAFGLSFVAAFARPEYAYGVFIAAAITLAALAFEFRQPQRSRNGLSRLLIVLSLAVTMQVIAHHSAADNRSGFAFVQHYNMRAIDDGSLSPAEGYNSKYAQRLFNLDLDRDPQQVTHTVGDFFRARPRLFLHHMLENALDYRTLLLVGFLLLAITWPWLRDASRPLRPAALYLACISLPPIMGTLVLYPREHYAMILIPSITLLLVQALPSLQTWFTLPALYRAATAVLLLAVLAGCARLSVHRLQAPPFNWRRENLERVRCARSLDQPLPDPRTIAFDSAADLHIYVPHLREPATQGTLPTLPSFETWVTAQHPVWVAIIPELSTQYATTPDHLDHFLTSEKDYVPHVCPGSANLTIYTEPTP